MAVLLVRTVDGENALRYMRGDVVAVFADGHVFGRMESLAVWRAEGRNPAQWPGGFAVVELPDMPLQDARVYVTDEPGRRRKYKFDIDAIERRAPATGRDTLHTESHIKRRASDPDVVAAFALKG
jgi:hypothetical protein